MTERKFTSYYPICYRLLFAVMITVIAIECMGYLAGIHTAGKWHWLVMSLTLLLLICLNYGKLGVRIISSIVLGFGILIMIPLVGAGQIVSFFSDYVSWLFQSGEYNDNEQWKLGYQLIQTIWVTIGCYIYQILLERKTWIKNITALVLLAALPVCMLLKKDIHPIGVIFCIVYILIWYVENVRGFIPASRLSLEHVEDLNEFLNKKIKVRVITVDPEKKRLVLSARELLREEARAEAAQKKQAALEQVNVGDVMDGTVETLKDYGAFVRLENGLSGLVHVSQISDKRVTSPSKVLKEGETVKVKVTAVKDGKLSLSMKALLEKTEEVAEKEEKYEIPKSETISTSLGSLLANIKLD